MQEIEQKRAHRADAPFAVGAAQVSGDDAASCDSSEQRVVRQFLEAVLFERLVDYESEPRSAEDAFSQEFEAVYDRRLSVRLGDRLYRCLGTISAFDRVRIATGSVRSLTGLRPGRSLLEDLVEGMPIDALGRARLRSELLQTLRLSRWNHTHLAHHLAPRRGLSFEQLETAILEGHQYHPSFKTRTGFTLQDHQKFGSEAENAFQLHFVAVRQDDVWRSIPADERAFWNAELGRTVFDDLTHRLQRSGRSWDDYSLLPVHPFQLEGLLPQLARFIESEAIIPLGKAGDAYRATQSLRTLANVSRPERPNIKLPLDIFCTSCRRNFRQHFVCTAPALSRWLATLVAGDDFLQGGERMQLLLEYAGAIWVPQGDMDGALEEPADVQKSRGKLGVIFRESLRGSLKPGEAAVPFTALCLVESDGLPFIMDWLVEHGTARWVDRLLEVTLVPLWHMLVHHGVAFEAHAQNLILVHRDGWPERIVLRDFHDDTEFVTDYLRSPESVPDFSTIDPYFATVPDDDGYRMGCTEDLRHLFMDTVCVFNLTEISFLLQRLVGFGEDEFWACAREHLQKYRESGVTDPARIDRIGSDRAEIVVESLLTKTIKRGDTLDYFEHTVRNALHPRGLSC